jgi:hypothetical protein
MSVGGCRPQGYGRQAYKDVFTASRLLILPISTCDRSARRVCRHSPPCWCAQIPIGERHPLYGPQSLQMS